MSKVSQEVVRVLNVPDQELVTFSRQVIEQFRHIRESIATVYTSATTLYSPPSRRGTYGKDALRWKLDDGGPADGLCGTVRNYGNGGVADMARTGSNLFVSAAAQSVLGTGAVRSGGSAATSYLSCLSSITMGNNVTVSAIVMLRKLSATASIIANLTAGGGTVFELGVSAAGVPYFIGRAVTSGVVTVNAVESIRIGVPYLLSGTFTNNSAIRVYTNGWEQASAAVVGAVDYTGAAPQYTLFNSPTGAYAAANYWNGQIEEVCFETAAQGDNIIVPRYNRAMNRLAEAA